MASLPYSQRYAGNRPCVLYHECTSMNGIIGDFAGCRVSGEANAIKSSIIAVSRLLYHIICSVRKPSADAAKNAAEKYCKIRKISFKKVLTTQPVFRIIIKHCDAELCNGSTCDSDSHCEGSNPSSATKRQRMLPLFPGYSADGSALRSGRRGLEFKSQYSDHTGSNTER